MGYRREFIEALKILARACERVAEHGRGGPILVGGAAVEFYTGGAVVSGDFDVVTTMQGELEAILEELGFERPVGPGESTKGLVHRGLLIGVEVVGSALLDGEGDRDRVLLTELDGREVTIIGIEDLIADRMGQYNAVPGGDPEMLSQAVRLMQFAAAIDETYLDAQIRSQTLGDFDLAFLKANLP